jgi:hypothetical protein
MDRRWTWGAYLFGALAVLASVLAFTYIYVSAEHTLYTWDFHAYSTRLEATYSELTHSPLRALVEVYLSTSQEYNLLPTIPLLPLRKVLGAGRIAYELNIAAIFVVPFVLAVGWIGSVTIPGRRGPVFWTTVLIALATPFTWIAILRGFVDLGAATFIVLAIGLYITDPRLTRLWRPIAIGALLAAAFLFRRPFAYDAVAFGAAVGVLVLARATLAARTGLAPAIRALVRDVLRSALVAFGGFVTLVAIGHRLLGRLLLQDAGALYQSYDLPAGSVVAWFISGFGWLIVLLAIGGFVALLRTRRLDERVLFIAIYGLVALLLWSLLVGQQGPHYAVHFVLPVVIGLSGLVWTIWQAGPAPLVRPAIAAIALVLLLNFAAGVSSIVPGPGSIVRAMVADPNPPMVRTDYEEMIRLVGDLRRIAGTDKAILVLGSTDGFSNDTVSIADDVSRGQATPLFVLNNPHVDSRDTYPLVVLLAADYAVVPDPFPMTLPAASEGVGRVLHDLFTSPSAVADAFRPLPDGYVLADLTRVQVFERTRPTTLPEAITALAKMREYTPTVPGSQVPWVSVGGLVSQATDRSGDRPPIIEAGRNEQGQWVANSLIYIGADASTAINGTAEFLDRTCAGVRLRLSSIDGKLADGAIVQSELAPAGPTSFRIAELGAGARDLLIAPEQLDPARPCESRITMTAETGDKAGAKSLLVNDAQPSP